MRELLLSFATWQDCIVHLQQTVYSCLYLTKKEYCTRSPDLFAFVQGLHYVINTYGQVTRSSAIFRDEDICFPLSFDKHYDIPPAEIVQRL